MYVTAVVLAAGRGLRLKSKASKALIKIGSKPLVIYSLGILSEDRRINDIVVVANRRNLRGIQSSIRQYRIKKIKGVVLGGSLRQFSVLNGLKAMDMRTDLVLIHDGARPFIDRRMVSSVLTAARNKGAAILGVPVKATVKSVRCQVPGARRKSFIVDKTLDRNKLWEIQTPQVFKKDLILEAYKRFAKLCVTDDAMLAEKLGAKVSVVRGAYSNIKITTPEDLAVAQAIARNLR